jgi:GAF domain-containing protein/sugar diacid utilization regulator
MIAGSTPPAAGVTPEVATVAVLRLLASDAPLSTVRDVIEQALQAAPDGDRAGWRELAGAATRLWEILSDRKHREHEVLALFDTAELLDRIVQRARQRFSSDTCYLVLTDTETGAARIRVKTGSAGSVVDQPHLPLGLGLVGVMERSGRPYFSPNYLEDANLVHEPGIDAFAMREGIISIAGAPLRLGAETVGALFVALRHERVFTDADLSLLASLANHAAIVLEKARLFAAMRDAVDDLQKANAEIESYASALERASTIHEQLTRLVLTGADLNELAATLAEVFGGELIVADAGLQLRAASPDASAHGLLARHADELTRLLIEVTGSELAMAATRLRDDPSRPAVWATPVRAGVETLGVLLLQTPHELGPADVRTLERSAQTAAVLVLMERMLAQAEEQVRGEFVDDLLGSRAPDWTSIERRARRLGLEPSAAHVALVASCAADHRRRLVAVSNAYARERGGVAGEWLGDVVLLVRHEDADTAGPAASAELSRSARSAVTVGAAGPVTGLPALRDAYRDAAQCHHVLLALGRVGQGSSLRALGMFGVLLETSTDERLQAFVESSLGPIAQYDRDNGTQLIETLDHYFAARCNPRVAAKHLHVHTNTVYQRLERIDALFAPVDWRAPEHALEVQLALKLRHILSSVGRSGRG